jgi:hypothetical protein
MTVCYLVEPNSAGAWHGSQDPKGRLGWMALKRVAHTSVDGRTAMGRKATRTGTTSTSPEVTQRHRAAFVSSQRRWMIHPITANRIHAAAAITD